MNKIPTKDYVLYHMVTGAPIKESDNRADLTPDERGPYTVSTRQHYETLHSLKRNVATSK